MDEKNTRNLTSADTDPVNWRATLEQNIAEARARVVCAQYEEVVWEHELQVLDATEHEIAKAEAKAAERDEQDNVIWVLDNYTDLLNSGYVYDRRAGAALRLEMPKTLVELRRGEPAEAAIRALALALAPGD